MPSFSQNISGSKRRCGRVRNGFAESSENSRDAIFLHQSGRIFDANPYVCNLLGYDKEKFLTMSLSDFSIAPGSQERRQRSKG